MTLRLFLAAALVGLLGCPPAWADDEGALLTGTLKTIRDRGVGAVGGGASAVFLWRRISGSG